MSDKKYNSKPINAVNVTKVYLDANENKNMTISYSDYMRGPGRFANASQIKMIDVFMNPWLHQKSQALAPGEYSKEQMKTIFGDKTSFHAHVFHQASYSDHIDDKIERAYVWGSVEMRVHDSVKYVVEPNGARYLKNFALVPKNDNFDFQGGTISQLANPILERQIDPHKKGKTVTLEIHTQNIPLKTFTYDDYVREQGYYKAKSIPTKDVDIREAIEFIQHLKQQMQAKGLHSAQITTQTLETILAKEKFYELDETKQSQAINLAINKDEFIDLQNQLADLEHTINHTPNQFGISPALKASLDAQMQERQENQQKQQGQARSL